jgi:dihydrofolate reductase
MSPDGYIAGPKGEFDWIPMDPDIDFATLFAQFDTAVMGRKTFVTTLQRGGTGAMPGLDVVVFSRTLRASDYPTVSIVTADPVDTVRSLKAKAGKDIWLFGGGELFSALLDAGVVDTVETAVVPILLGEGIPVVPSRAVRKKLSLTAHRLYPKSGIMSLEYAIGPRPKLT